MEKGGSRFLQGKRNPKTTPPEIVGESCKPTSSLSLFIRSFNFATFIATKVVPFGRNYWAEMPPLKKIKYKILDESCCWDDLRNLPTDDEKKEICAWDGWHWILKGQLECFFGLREKFEPPGHTHFDQGIGGGEAEE